MMTNEEFLLLTREEREEKFRAVLGRRCRGALTEQEMDAMLRILSADRQYEILIYHRIEEFRAGITKREGTEKHLVLGMGQIGRMDGTGGLCPDVQSGTAAVTVRKHTTEEECSELHIFIPPERCREKKRTRRTGEPSGKGRMAVWA